MKYPNVILITGASSGLGAALADCYAGTGKTLCLTGRNADRLEKTAEICRTKGADVKTAILDICDHEAVTRQFQTWDDEAPIDLLIANAGISAGTGGGKKEKLDQVKQVLSTNVDGVITSVYALLDRMEFRGRGQIAIISSIAGLRGLPGAPAYCASKAAVRSLGESLRSTLRPMGINVSTVCPGFIHTPMTEVNKFPMPFRLEAAKAARIIRKGLAKNKAMIAFPWILYLVARIFSILPYAITDRISARAPSKTALD